MEQHGNDTKCSREWARKRYDNYRVQDTVPPSFFHVVVAVASRPSFALGLHQNLFAVIVRAQPSGHISPLTLGLGSIIAGLHCSALYAHISQTLI